MISDTTPRTTASGASTGPTATEGSYVDWAAILAGAVLALAISFLLISFGATLGLSLTSPFLGEGVSASWLAIAAGIWFAWVMVTGFGAGGYLAGRMRRRAGDATTDEVQVRDGAHGLMVWATGALVSTVLAASGVGGLLNAGASVVGSAAGTLTDVAGEALSSDYMASVLLRDSVDGPAAEAAEGAALPATSGPNAATTMGEPVATETAGIDPSVRTEIAGILMRSVTSGELADRDRDHLARLVSANTDLDADAARARIDEVNTEIADARASALAAVERARVASVVFGFIAAATLLIGALAAFFAAAAGGRHRDDGLGLDVFAARP